MPATGQLTRWPRRKAGAHAASSRSSAASTGPRHSKSCSHVLRESEAVKFAFIAENVAVLSICGMCRLLQVSPSGYCAWLHRPKSNRECDNEVLALEIEAIHEQSRGTYGSPRITHELHEQGRQVSKKRVAKRIKEWGIEGKKRRRFRKTTDSKQGLPVPPNVLARDVTQDAPNKVWVTDGTAIYTTGWLHLAVILDLFSRSVVSWATNSVSGSRVQAFFELFQTFRPVRSEQARERSIGQEPTVCLAGRAVVHLVRRI